MIFDKKRCSILGLYIVCALMALPGCSVYLHNDSFDQLATQAKADFGKIDVSTVFVQQQSRLSTLATKEDQAVTAFNIGRRNYAAIDLIHPSSATSTLNQPSLLRDREYPCASESMAKTRLQCMLNKDLSDILGNGNSQLSDDEISILATLPETFRIDQSTTSGAYANFKMQLNYYIKERPPGDTWPTDCANILKKGSVTVTVTDRLSERRQRLFENCSFITPQDPLIEIIGLNVGGRLGDALKSYQEAQNKQQLQLEMADELKVKLKSIGIPEAPDPVAGDVTKAIDGARKALDGASGIAAKIGWTLVSCSIDKLLTKELRTPSSTPEGATSPKKETQSEACKAAKPSSGDGSAQTGTSTNNNISENQKGKTVTELVLGATGAIDEYSQQSALEHVNSLLLAKAQVTHLLNIASVQADYAEDQIRIATAKVMSLARQLRHVNRAKHFANMVPSGSGFDVLVASGNPYKLDGAGMALSEWVAGQNEGYIPWRVLNMKEYQLARAYTVKLAATTNEDFNNLMQPVFNDLEAYGKGGVSPETIARVLADIGLLAAIVAK